MNGEEVSQGRAWARIATGPHAGEAWQLPRLGRDVLRERGGQPASAAEDGRDAHRRRQLEHRADCERLPERGLRLRRHQDEQGSIIDRAGLTNGALYGLKITVGSQPVPEESNDFGLGTAASGFVGSGRFSLHNFGDVSALDALALEQASIAAWSRGFNDPRTAHGIRAGATATTTSTS